jgi:hypothetical protein
VPSTFLVSICGRDGCPADAPGWALGAVGCAGACDQPGLAIVVKTIATMDASNVRAMFLLPVMAHDFSLVPLCSLRLLTARLVARMAGAVHSFVRQ